MRLLLLSVLLFFIGFKAQAQKYMGVKAGINLATATGLVYWNYVRPGFHAGLYREDYLKESLIIRSELLYSQKGWQATAFIPNYGTWSIDGYPVAKNVVGMCSLEYTL